MVRIKCVKCGVIVENWREIEFGYPFIAPCCEDCLPAVETELMNDASMWPSDWHGGWSWFGEDGWIYYPPNGILKSRES